jgi:hypothetical protein
VKPQSVIELKAFDDPVYLHQTIERRKGATTRYLDLPDALTAYDGESDGREWRTHFHVPVFLDQVGTFKTTRPEIEAALRYHASDPVSDQVEIETYTWDVLPDSFKTGDVIEYVSRELEWVRDSLLAAAN